ncbi:MAG: division/cell wall cluster transcriptional repressor MraZ [Deltaproteobacteria bacterium]|nr:division/cell wall cluster transcriptional repressor MraZ [Deltaproteobacteria bacterium]
MEPKNSSEDKAERARYSFCGSFTHSLDEKGRISIPSTFRQLLQERKQNVLVLTNFISAGARCIEAFAQDEWLRLEQKLAGRSRFDPKLQKLENFYLARAAACPMDASGRINIPQHLRSYAGLEREVVFTSTLNGFRIWESRVWSLVFQEAEAALLEDPALFMDVDI